jgi:hypothetical protein
LGRSQTWILWCPLPVELGYAQSQYISNSKYRVMRTREAHLRFHSCPEFLLEFHYVGMILLCITDHEIDTNFKPLKVRLTLCGIKPQPSNHFVDLSDMVNPPSFCHLVSIDHKSAH